MAQKVRRVPFSLKGKVTEKVNELLENDIFERVDGPTTWVSPTVVAPKASGDIQLCVDTRRANTAIKREKLPIPTVDEILEDLNGSTFSPNSTSDGDLTKLNWRRTRVILQLSPPMMAYSVINVLVLE